jgi:hypothetical protein
VALQIVKNHARIDAVGMLLSAFCMLHCVALTALLLSGGALASFWRDGEDLTHVIMLAVVVPVSVIAFGGGWLRHRRADVVWLGAIGILTLALAALFAHDHYGASADAGLSIAGGAALAVAHWRNRRRCGCPGTVTAA